MTTFQDRAYAMTALSVVVGMLKILVKNGLITRDEAVRAILDEAVGKALAAEGEPGEGAVDGNMAEANRQSAEFLKFIADQL
jgi:hypothetical protein